MKPLIVLLIAFILSVAVFKIVTGNIDYYLSGRIAMCVMLLFTAIAHFTFSKGMVMMIPAFVPYRLQIVHLTGVMEILAAIALLFHRFSLVAGWSLVVFFILLLPANIYAAIKFVDIRKANFEGAGLRYLWFRIPLQIVFIAWVYVSSIVQH
jgi:uncharacterized membrane protein